MVKSLELFSIELVQNFDRCHDQLDYTAESTVWTSDDNSLEELRIFDQYHAQEASRPSFTFIGVH